MLAIPNIDKRNNLHLALKYSRTFVLRHYLFLEAHGFPRAPFSEQITTVRGRISINIVTLNGRYYFLSRDFFR